MRFGPLVAGGVVVGLVGYFVAVGPQRADQLGSAIGAVVALAALLAPYVKPLRERTVARREPAAEDQPGDDAPADSKVVLAGRDAKVGSGPWIQERATVVAVVVVFAIFAILAAFWLMSAASPFASGNATDRDTQRVAEGSDPAYSPSVASRPPSPAVPSAAGEKPLITATRSTTSPATRPVPARTPDRPKSDPEAGAAKAGGSEAGATGAGGSEAGATGAGQVSILGNRYVDFDQRPPLLTPANPQNDIPNTVDLRVGPDNLYPVNGAVNWFKQSGRCADERAALGLEGELVLKEKLAGGRGAVVTVCLATTQNRYYTLRITTDQADGGGDPYHFAFTLDG